MTSKTEFIKAKAVKDICKLIGPLSAPEEKKLEDYLTLQKYKKNEIIYKDFDTPTHALCLIQGKVKIYKDGIGRNQILRVVKPIEFFGYRAFFAQEDYRTSAMALEPSAAAVFPIDILRKLLTANFSTCKFFLHKLSEELGASDDRMVNLTQKHIRGRLAEALLFLKDSYGVEEDGHTLSIYLSREDMASLSNMTTSNAIRTLSAFANEKLIAIDGKKIKIIEEEKLHKVSRMG